MWAASIPAAADSNSVWSYAPYPGPPFLVARLANANTNPSSLDSVGPPLAGGDPLKSFFKILQGSVHLKFSLPRRRIALGVGLNLGSIGLKLPRAPTAKGISRAWRSGWSAMCAYVAAFLFNAKLKFNQYQSLNRGCGGAIMDP